MNKSAQEFDPHEILLEHKKFFEDHRAAFSPLPKRILTPTESDNKIPSMHPSDHGNYYSVMPKQNEALSGEHQNYSVESPEGKNKELLIMTIEIGDGNKDTLRVFEHDDPYELAKRFCETHDLNPKIVEPLAQNIYANMEKVLEERAEALDGEKEEQAPAKESEFESFKDTGMRTGEFKSFSDIGQEQKHLNQHHNTYQRQQQQQQQQQRQQEQQEKQLQSQIQQLHQYYQQQQRQQEQEQQQQQQYKQLPLQQYHKPQINNKENRELEYSKEKDHHDAIREYEPERSVSHANRSSDIAQTPWESPEKQLLAQRGFHMRSSFDGKVQKNRNSQNTTNIYEGTTHEDLSRNQTSKPLDTTNRRSYFDYPSDPRLHNASYIPESFQNEEEYLEYLITSQYGGNQKHEVKNTDYTFTPNINRSSKVMLENKYQNSRLNVYDRLHNHARNKVQNKKNTSQTDISPRKSTGPASRKSTRQNSTDNSRGAGTGLYYRGMKRKEEVKRMLEDFKQERTIEEDRSCTFKPYINPISSEIVNSKPKYERTEDTLINYGRATQEKLERARSVKKVKEVEGCTFQPMINSISAKLVHEREGMSQDGPKDRFTKLFHDHKVRQAQQEMRSKALSAQEGCTFSPMINSHSEAIIDRTNFVDRARKFENKISKIENLRREREEMELFDAETGQPLFRPSVGRPPKQEKRERKQSIGDYLYNQRFEKENLRKSLCEQEKKQRDSQIIRTSEKSQMIMENIQRNKLQAIFSLLDSDEDGYISSSRIDIGSLGTHTLEAFAPLLCEMEELDQTLSLQDFIEAAEKLLKTLPVHERDMIIMSEKFERRSSQPVKFPFHPEINRKSSKLAQGQRPYGNFEALYDHYMGEQKVKEDKLKQEQEKKKQEELKDCSFKPMLMPESNMPLISMNNYNYYYVDHLI